MIRTALLVTGFVVSTLGLVWILGGDDESGLPVDQVSRTVPDPLGLQPALSDPGDYGMPQVIATETVEQSPAALPGFPIKRPVLRPAGIATRPVNASLEGNDPRAYQAPASADEKVNRALEAMGYGILEELKKPARTEVSAVEPVQQAVQTARVATPDPQDIRLYTVQPGDSLPGIAFRFYGTTVAYLDILKANSEQLRSPGDVKAGMILRIPEI